MYRKPKFTSSLDLNSSVCYLPGTIESTIFTASLPRNDLPYLLFPMLSELCPQNNMQTVASAEVSNYAALAA